jgi:hypothetical protein
MSKSSIEVITTELSRFPSRFRIVRRSAHRMQRRTLHLAKRRPGRSLLGAFAIGFAASRLLRLMRA